ncbi:MAG: SLC13 family permease [Kiritimatiellae bacterium]|nr:SLC13 family permease [Kiritimatiellia bacterium]
MPDFLTPALIVFVLTYVGVALGGIPGLAIDRTGIALLGAVAMVACGALDTSHAVAAIDFPTILLLYGLMVLSSQLRLGGFYTRVALGLTSAMDRPRRFLWVSMAASAALSAVLTNDIVCLAFAPVLAWTVTRRSLNPLPFLLGLAIASNIGSAATIIGNPQNMLLGQVGHLSFDRFFAWCLVPSSLALIAAYGLICWRYRGKWQQGGRAFGPGESSEWPAYQAGPSRKGLIVGALLVAAFFTPIPRELSALAAAALLMCSRRMRTRSLMGFVDWHLIALFCGLFVVVRGFELTGWPARLVSQWQAHGFNLAEPFTLTASAAALSNVVSNVPAVMLLTKFLDVNEPRAWYILAVAGTFAGNLITIGSIANLIVIEQAKLAGVVIRFREHARIGVPVTLVSLAILCGWIFIAP